MINNLVVPLRIGIGSLLCGSSAIPLNLVAQKPTFSHPREYVGEWKAEYTQSLPVTRMRLSAEGRVQFESLRTVETMDGPSTRRSVATGRWGVRPGVLGSDFCVDFGSGLSCFLVNVNPTELELIDVKGGTRDSFTKVLSARQRAAVEQARERKIATELIAKARAESVERVARARVQAEEQQSLALAAERRRRAAPDSVAWLFDGSLRIGLSKVSPYVVAGNSIDSVMFSCVEAARGFERRNYLRRLGQSIRSDGTHVITDELKGDEGALRVVNVKSRESASRAAQIVLVKRDQEPIFSAEATESVFRELVNALRVAASSGSCRAGSMSDSSTRKPTS